MQLSADWIGWLATAIFLVSYSCKDQGQLRRVQALAAVLWVVYGVILHAVPIVVANLLVAGVALYSSLSGSLAARRQGRRPPPAGLTPAAAPDLSRIS
jgi:hypothetical protein